MTCDEEDRAATGVLPKACQGRCHCGAVRFEARIRLADGLSRCNCTICIRRGALTAIVRPADFRLVSSGEAIEEYRPGAGRYSFCRVCGIHLFGRADLEMHGGEIVAVNVNCVDDLDLAGTVIRHCDGRNDSWAILKEETVDGAHDRAPA